MARDKQFEELLSQFNIAKAENRDLREQIKQKEAVWHEEMAKMKVMESLARDLCESILAKDPSEMVLNQDYSWRSVATPDLIKKAQASYKSYNQTRAELMTTILDQSESRAAEIESLQDQIVQLMAGNGSAYQDAQEVILKAEKEAKKKSQSQSINIPYAVQSAANEGTINLIIEDEEDVEIDGEKVIVEDLLNINEQLKTTALSIPVADSKRRKKEKEKRKEEAIMAHMVNLAEFEDRMSDLMWEVLYAIGGKGFSKYQDIEGCILERNPDTKPNRVRRAATESEKMGLIDKTDMRLPTAPKGYAYRLSEIGSRLFRKRFDEKPVLCELERIIAEHDNPEHGYGIMEVAKILEDKEWYDEVCAWNRKKNAVKLGNNQQYIADIIAITPKYKEYYEYERGLHTQKDFNDKCNKMVKVTRYLNFVAPNKEVLLKHLKPKIDAWIKSRGQESLRNTHIRLTTALQLRDGQKKDNSCWLILYNLNKGEEPIKTIE